MRLLDRRWRSPEAFVDAIEGKAIRNRPDLRAPLLDWGRARLPRLTSERADANHLTLLFDPPGPKAIV